MALKLDILANTRQLVGEMKKAGASVEDISDSLDDMAKDGDQAGERLERSFREITKAADKSAKSVKRDYKQAFDGVKQEAGQSGREAAQSFGGGFEDVADFAQETLAQAFSGFGPAAAAAGVAVAAALGAALQGAADAQERLAEARERAAELSQTLYENKGDLPMEDAISRVLELLPSERGAGNPLESFLNQWLDLGTNIEAVRRAAKTADTPLRTFIRGLSGADLDATTDALKAVDEAIASVHKKAAGELNFENGQAINQLEALKSQLQGVQTTADLAKETLGAVGSSFESAEYIAKVEAIGQAWEDAATDAGDYVTEQDGIATFDWSAYLANAESTLAASNEFKRKIFTVPDEIQDEGERIFAEQGPKAANAYLTAYETASVENRQRFVDAAKANAESTGQAAGEAYAREAESAAQAKAQGWGSLPMPVRPDLSGFDSAIRRYVPPPIYVRTLSVDSRGRVLA